MGRSFVFVRLGRFSAEATSRDARSDHRSSDTDSLKCEYQQQKFNPKGCKPISKVMYPPAAAPKKAAADDRENTRLMLRLLLFDGTSNSIEKCLGQTAQCPS